MTNQKVKARKLRLIAFEARELRVTAFHEAGHFVLHRSFGGQSSPEVWRNDSGDPYKKAWRGRNIVYSSSIDMPYPPDYNQAFLVIPAPARWRVYWGMAGIVSEEIESGCRDPAAIYERFTEEIDQYISATDRNAMGVDWSLADVAVTKDLLVARWQLVTAIAQELVLCAQ